MEVIHTKENFGGIKASDIHESPLRNARIKVAYEYLKYFLGCLSSIDLLKGLLDSGYIPPKSDLEKLAIDLRCITEELEIGHIEILSWGFWLEINVNWRKYIIDGQITGGKVVNVGINCDDINNPFRLVVTHDPLGVYRHHVPTKIFIAAGLCSLLKAGQETRRKYENPSVTIGDYVEASLAT